MLAGNKIVLCRDGHLMDAIAAAALIGTWLYPIPGDQLARLHGLDQHIPITATLERAITHLSC